MKLVFSSVIAPGYILHSFLAASINSRRTGRGLPQIAQKVQSGAVHLKHRVLFAYFFLTAFLAFSEAFASSTAVR